MSSAFENSLLLAPFSFAAVINGTLERPTESRELYDGIYTYLNALLSSFARNRVGECDSNWLDLREDVTHLTFIPPLIFFLLSTKNYSTGDKANDLRRGRGRL